MITDIPCIILSGGKSSRMGEDKSLLPFGEFDTLIEYQYNKLSKIFKDVYISSKENKFNFQANIIIDSNKDISSAMVALEAIFKKFEGKKVFIITVDVPFLHTDTILQLIDNSKDFLITIAQDEEKTHNLCGVFDTLLLKDVITLLYNNIHKINYLIKTTSIVKVIPFKERKQFLNLNERLTYNEAYNISKNYIKY